LSTNNKRLELLNNSFLSKKIEKIYNFQDNKHHFDLLFKIIKTFLFIFWFPITIVIIAYDLILSNVVDLSMFLFSSGYLAIILLFLNNIVEINNSCTYHLNEKRFILNRHHNELFVLDDYKQLFNKSYYDEISF